MPKNNRVRHHHFLKRVADVNGDGRLVLCDSPHGNRFGNVAESPERITCPECSVAYWGERLAQEAATRGVAIKLERIVVPRDAKYDARNRLAFGYRSVSKIIIDGAHCGWLVLPNGFAEPYRVAGHGVPTYEDQESVTLENACPGSPQTKPFVSKEAALFHVLTMSDAERTAKNMTPIGEWLIDARTAIANRKKRDAERAEEERQRKIDRAEFDARKAIERTEAEAQLRELHARADLTNYQRAGLAWALAKLNINLTPPQEETIAP